MTRIFRLSGDIQRIEWAFFCKMIIGIPKYITLNRIIIDGIA